MSTIRLIVILPIFLAVIGLSVYMIILVIKALRKYIGSKSVREEKVEFRKSLGEVLKENRSRSRMTQEYVAEMLGVSRQAVSKWENGTSDPSTSNLLALGKLYGISVEQLLESVNA